MALLVVHFARHYLHAELGFTRFFGVLSLPSNTLVVFGMRGNLNRQKHGERFDMHAMTAAHKTLRMNTRIRCTNLRNGRSVVVRINDRGPYARGRVVDLSYAAAKQIDMIDAGVVPVRCEVVD